MKKTLYITSGAPGAGKTSFVDARIDALDGIHISRDTIRLSLLAPGDYYFKNEHKVFNTFIEKIQKAINNPIGKKDIYIDATHLNYNSRAKVLKKLSLGNVDKIIILWFDIPVETLLKRNIIDGKERVPASAIETMANSMDKPHRFEYNTCLPYEVWRVDEEGWIDVIDK